MYYFSKEDTDFIAISDDVTELQKHAGQEWKETNKVEFLRAGYVTENETLFENIFQVMPGECVTISKLTGEVKREYYFRMWYEASLKRETDIQKWIVGLDTCLEETFSDLLRRLNGRAAIVPLSGGCDSRIVAVMLKRSGYENVICFSYGEKENPEAVVSKKIAETLGYKWHFVEYTGEKWKYFLESSEYHEYLAYAGMGGSGNIAHLQTVPALLELLKDGKVPSDGVVIPGHTLDYSAGGHIPSAHGKKKYSKQWLINYIIRYHYNLNKRGDISVAIQKWADVMPDVMDRSKLVQEYMLWEWKNRQAKFISNDVRGYEYAGLGWELPFWESQVSEFWLKVPINLLEKRKLQYMYMKQVIDPAAGVCQTYPYELENSEQKKEFIKRVFPFTDKLYEIYYWIFKIHFSRKSYAFYGYLSPVMHIKYMIKYGLKFSLNTIVAEDYIEYLQEAYQEKSVKEG